MKPPALFRALIPGVICLILVLCTGGRHPEYRHLVFTGFFSLAALVFGAAALRPKSFVRTAHRIPFTLIALPLWGYLGWHYFHTSPIPILAMENAVALLAFTLFADLCWLVRPGQRRGRLHLAWGTTAIALIALAGVAVYVSGMAFPTFSPRILTLPDRATGPFDNANHFACWINIGSLAALALLLSRHVGGLLKVLLGFELVILIGALLLTLSRSAQAAFAVGLLILGGVGLLRSTRKRGRVFPVVLTLFFSSTLVLFALLTPEMNHRWGTMKGNLRSKFWDNALEMIQQAPAFGHGAGSYAYTARPTSTYWFTDYVVNHAHNEVLNLAAEIGWVGFAIAVLSLLPIALLSALPNRKGKPSQPDALPYLPGVIWLVLGLQSMVDLNLRIPALAFTAIYFASLLARRPPKVPQPKPPGPAFRMTTLLLAVLCFAGGALSTSLWQGHHALRKGTEAASTFDLFHAKELYQQAHQRSPRDWRPARALAEWHLRFGSMQHGSSRNQTLDEGLRWADTAIRLNSFDTNLHISKARILQAQGNLSEARNLLEEQLVIDRRNFNVHRYLAEVYIAQQDWAKAHWILGKFTRRERDYAWARERLIMVSHEINVGKRSQSQPAGGPDKP